MIQIDPIIAVKDVQASAKWYEQIFGFRNSHGGENFAVLKSGEDKIMLCLHKWGEHQHSSLKNENLPSGNGLLLYFRTNDIEKVRENLDKSGYPLEEEMHLNSNSLRKEFSVRDPDNYYLTVTEFHEYEG